MPRQFSICSYLLIHCLPFFVEGSVGVRDVEFDRINGNSSPGYWLECTIEVEVRRDSQDPTRKNPSYLDDLVVKLMLGVEVESESGKTFEFFRSEASLVSLKEGRHYIRFYLPPEIVERDRVRNEVHSFLVQLVRSGALFLRQFRGSWKGRRSKTASLNGSRKNPLKTTAFSCRSLKRLSLTPILENPPAIETWTLQSWFLSSQKSSPV